MGTYKTKYNPFSKSLQWVITGETLDEGGANEITASELVNNIYNVILLAFKVAVQGSLTLFNMIDGFVDEYEDESGIDTTSSINELYYSGDDYYTPTSSGIDLFVKLLLHCDGIDGSTTFTDNSESAHMVTSGGDAQIDTDLKKFGTGSCLLDGNSDYLSVPASSDWNWDGDFTVDFWTYTSSLSSTEYVITVGETALYIVLHGSTKKIKFYGGGLDDYLSTGAVLSENTWMHIAVVRSGSTITGYVNGIAGDNPLTSSSTIGNSTDPLIIGGLPSVSQYYAGWIDEVRVSKGIARWTENFTPPSSEYASIKEAMTLISENFTAESEPSSARIVIFEEDVDVITLNTDLKAHVSKDNGSTWAETILEDEGDYDATKRILVGNVDLTQSGIGSGTNIRYKLVTDNEKDLKIHGTGLLWD